MRELPKLDLRPLWERARCRARAAPGPRVPRPPDPELAAWQRSCRLWMIGMWLSITALGIWPAALVACALHRQRMLLWVWWITFPFAASAIGCGLASTWLDTRIRHRRALRQLDQRRREEEERSRYAFWN